MTVFVEPNESFPVVLKRYEHLPKENQPTFFALSRTMRQQRKLLTMLDRLTDDENGYKTHDEAFTDAVQTLSEVVVGWKNFSVEFSKEAFEDVLSYTEARELIRSIANNQHVKYEEKKS